MDLLALYGVLRPLWVVWFVLLFVGQGLRCQDR